MKILLADCNARSRRFVRMMLSNVRDIEVLEASSVEGAMQVVASNALGLLLLAFGMRGTETEERSGIEILRRVRASGIKTPAVIIAETVELADVRVAMQLGANDYVLRSMLTPDLLVQLVDRFIDRTQKVRQAVGSSHRMQLIPGPTPTSTRLSSSLESMRALVSAEMAAAALTAAKAPTPRAANPLNAPGLFGRGNELGALAAFLESDRKVAIVTGPAGIGKSTVMRAFVDRHRYRPPGGVNYISFRNIPISIARIEVTTISQRQGLVILDDMDAATVGEIDELAALYENPASGNCKTIIVVHETSAALKTRCVVIAMKGLEPDAGVQLVRWLANQRGAEELADGNAARALATELCGHPMLLDLAVGLVARTQNNSGVVTARASWDERLSPTEEARWRNMVEAAVTNLGEDGQWVLERLGNFPDGCFTREELDVVADAAMLWPAGFVSLSERITTGLDACIASGLVSANRAENRYRIHPKIGTYVEDVLPPSQRTGNVLEFLSLLAISIRSIRRPDRYASGIDSSACRTLSICDKAASMGLFQLEDLSHFVGRRMPHVSSFVNRAWEVKLQAREPVHVSSRFRDPRQLHVVLQSLATAPAYARSNNRAGLATALTSIAIGLHQPDITIEGKTLFNHAANLAQETGQFELLLRLASHMAELNDIPLARSYFAQAHRIAIDRGENLQQSTAIRAWVRLEVASDESSDVRQFMERLAQVDRDIGGRASATRGEADLFRITVLREWIQATKEHSKFAESAAALAELARIEWRLNRVAVARVAFVECVQLLRDRGDREVLADALVMFGKMEMSSGFVREGTAYLREALALLEGQAAAQAEEIRAMLRSADTMARGRGITRAMSREGLQTVGENSSARRPPNERKITIQDKRS